MENPSYLKIIMVDCVDCGHRILPNGIMAHWAKVLAILEMPNPIDVHTLRSFIGLCNYYMIYVQDFSTISSSLYTSQSSAKLLMKLICTNLVTIILMIEQPLLTTPSVPNKDNTTDHNPQQQPTPTRRRDKFFDKFVVVILLVPPSSPPPSPTLHFSMLAIFIWYNFHATFRPPS